MNRIYFIGIAGGSCSGKTTLARLLAQRLGARRVACIAIDSYYRGLSSKSPGDIEQYNFDEPDALDRELLLRHLGDLVRGIPVEVPVYDFTTHARTVRTEHIAPVPFVIVEGLFPLYWDTVRSVMNTKVFVEVSHDVCLERRLRRDTVERGRPREEVMRRYNDMARPMYEKYVLPSKRYADVVIDGAEPIEGSVPLVIRHIDANR
jgi:uridine kinase